MALPRSRVIPSARQIRAIRKRLGLTQAQAAAKIWSGRRTWMYWEAGKQRPSYRAALLIYLLREGVY